MLKVIWIVVITAVSFSTHAQSIVLGTAEWNQCRKSLYENIIAHSKQPVAQLIASHFLVNAQFEQSRIETALDQFQKSPNCQTQHDLEFMATSLHNWKKNHIEIDAELESKNKTSRQVQLTEKEFADKDARRAVAFVIWCSAKTADGSMTEKECAAQFAEKFNVQYPDDAKAQELYDVAADNAMEVKINCFKQEYAPYFWPLWDYVLRLQAAPAARMRQLLPIAAASLGEMEQMVSRYAPIVDAALNKSGDSTCNEPKAVVPSGLIRLSNARSEGDNYRGSAVVLKSEILGREKVFISSAYHVVGEPGKMLISYKYPLAISDDYLSKFDQAQDGYSFESNQTPEALSSNAMSVVSYGRVPTVGQTFLIAGFPSYAGGNSAVLKCRFVGFVPSAVDNGAPSYKETRVSYGFDCPGAQGHIGGMSGGPIYDENETVWANVTYHLPGQNLVGAVPISVDTAGTVHYGIEQKVVSDSCYTRALIWERTSCIISNRRFHRLRPESDRK